MSDKEAALNNRPEVVLPLQETMSLGSPTLDAMFHDGLEYYETHIKPTLDVKEPATQVASITSLESRRAESQRTPKFGNIGRVAAAAVAVASLAYGSTHNSGVADKAPVAGAAAMPQVNLENGKSLVLTENLNELGQEAAYGIAGHGSCDMYTKQQAIDASEGKFTPLGNILDAQHDFLTSNDSFNTNYTAGARERVPQIFEGLALDDNATMADVVSAEGFTQGKLVNALNVDNTYCDEEGNVHFYRNATLEAGTGVGGIEITNIITNAADRMVVTLSTGEKITLPDNGLVGDVEKLDGTTVKMLISNKLGILVDNNGEQQFVGCFNILTKSGHKLRVRVPKTTAPNTVPKKTTTTLPQTTTTVPKTTTTTAPSTTTTVPKTTTTTVPKTTTTTVPKTTTTTVPKTTTTTVPKTTTTTAPTTTTTATPKNDDGVRPGVPEVPADQDKDIPDKPGQGPAGQTPDNSGYLPGENKPEAPAPTPPAQAPEKPRDNGGGAAPNPPQPQAPPAPAIPGPEAPNTGAPIGSKPE